MQILITTLNSIHSVVFVYGFGILTSIALIIGLFLLWREVQRTSFKESSIFDMVFLSLFTGLFLGRLIFFLIEKPDFPLNLFNFIIVYVFPGFSRLGIYAGFFTALYFLSLRYKKNFIDVLRLTINPFVFFISAHSFLSFARDGNYTNLFRAILFAVIIAVLSFVIRAVRTGKYKAVCIAWTFFAAISIVEFLLAFKYSIMDNISVGLPGIEGYIFAGIGVVFTALSIFCINKNSI